MLHAHFAASTDGESTIFGPTGRLEEGQRLVLLDQVKDWCADAEGRPQPGPTTSSNLAPLCRFHHRLKTHTTWRYTVTWPGEYEWTSPHGHQFRRDPTGSTAIEPREPPEPDDRR